MITVEEASEIVLGKAIDFGTEVIDLDQSIGRVLREDICADRDFPPYDRVTMDGIAIVFDAFQSGQRTFEIKGIASAGAEQLELNYPECCVEVMTGAIMPKHFDTVIRYEDIEISEGVAHVTVDDIHHQQNIHFKGEDRTSGDVVISAGVRITSTEVGVCATVGKARVLVSRMPRTVIISTGDELVDIHEIPQKHQIRRSNVYRLMTSLRHYDMHVDTKHLVDDYDQILETLESVLKQYDLVILSGGVSKGKFDFLPDALLESGVEKFFHRIKQRPGKPFWFGSKGRTTVFAFPGNPVSSFMCMQQYFIPWLETSIRMKPRKTVMAELAADVYFTPDLTYFLEVRLEFDASGKIMAYPVKGNGSGDLANLVDADAFIKLPMGRDTFFSGESFPLVIYRNGML